MASHLLLSAVAAGVAGMSGVRCRVPGNDARLALLSGFSSGFAPVTACPSSDWAQTFTTTPPQPLAPSSWFGDNPSDRARFKSCPSSLFPVNPWIWCLKPWINVLQMGFLLMNRKGFGSWETVSAGTIQACNVCFHFHIIVCLSISRLPRPQLANDNQLQMQVYPLGFILSWKKCVKFLDCLSWLVPIQWLSHNISLERHSALAEPMGEFQPHRTVTLLQGTGELQSFSQGLVWPAILTGWLLLAPSRVLSLDTIDIWGQIIYCG